MTENEEKRRSRGRNLLATIGAALLIVVTAFLTRSGERLAELWDGPQDSGQPVSYSVAPLDEGLCDSGGAFLPDSAARTVLRQTPPTNSSELYRSPGAAFVESATAEVSVQGESQRTITLTGISFDVIKLGKRPLGVTLHGQCGDASVGRSLEVDLDATPPKVIRSNAALGRLETRPIRFPWTVSLTDPLLLYITAKTESCFCEWSAKIPWVSGSKRGTLVVNNEGQGFRLVSSNGLPSYLSAGGQWHRSGSSF